MKFALKICAVLENIESLRASNADFIYLLKFKCCNCGETSQTWHDIAETKTYSTKTSKSEVHYMEKCKLCSRENTLEIVKNSTGTYSKDDAGFKTIVVFECRGLTPEEFNPSGGEWTVIAESGKTFQATLEENEWVDYDDRGNQSVGIYEFKSQIEKIK